MRILTVIMTIWLLTEAGAAWAVQPLGPLTERFDGSVTGRLSYSDISLEYTLHDDEGEHSYGIYSTDEQRKVLKKHLGRRLTLFGEILVYVPGVRYIDIRKNPDALKPPAGSSP